MSEMTNEMVNEEVTEVTNYETEEVTVPDDNFTVWVSEPEKSKKNETIVKLVILGAGVAAGVGGKILHQALHANMVRLKDDLTLYLEGKMSESSFLERHPLGGKAALKKCNQVMGSFDDFFDDEDEDEEDEETK